MKLLKTKRYPTYKDSGVEWLGEVPKHWEICKTKYFWKEVISLSENGDEALLSVSQYTGVSQNENDSRSVSLAGYKKVSENNLVINIMLAWLGGLGLSQLKGVVSPAYAVYELIKESHPSYFHYLYRTNLYLDEFARKSKGVVPSRWRMYTDDFGQVLTIQPSLPEQKRIADYLDKKTEQIDKAIAQKEQMIELLKERKQILINRAVTRGLNPDVPLKDSDVDWIGQIPVHWEVRKLKYIAKLKSGETITSDEFIKDGAFPVYGGNGLRGYTNKGFTNEGLYVLIGRQGALCGNINYAKDQFWASEHAVVVYPNIGYKIKWLGETLRVMDLNQYSQSAAQPGIAVEKIVNLSLPLPSIKEQKEIVSHIERNTEKIDKAIFLKQEEIEKLKEYKSTLIDSAVTGKICLMN